VQSRNIPTFGNHRRSVPQATVHSSLVALAWFAWHSIPVTLMDISPDIVGTIQYTPKEGRMTTTSHVHQQRRLCYTIFVTTIMDLQLQIVVSLT
jgi:hypothetical protein